MRDPIPREGETDGEYEKHFNNLRGIRPGLVAELAALHGAALEDVSVTVRIMPYGDRAVLGAYGYFTDSQMTVMSPDFMQLIDAAFSVVVAAVKPEDIAHILDGNEDS